MSLTLARLHLECLFSFDREGRMTAVRETGSGPPPRFVLFRTPKGHLPLVRSDLPAATASALLRAAAAEPPLQDPEAAPLFAETYRRLLAGDEPIRKEYAGPAFVLPESPSMPAGLTPITAANASLLPTGYDHIEERLPTFAVVEGGIAVSVCESVRWPSTAAEAGVMTLEAYRGRGYASRVVAAWACAVRSEGRLPLYSTWWENAASRAVAARLGATLYGVDYSLT